MFYCFSVHNALCNVHTMCISPLCMFVHLQGVSQKLIQLTKCPEYHTGQENAQNALFVHKINAQKTGEGVANEKGP